MSAMDNPLPLTVDVLYRQPLIRFTMISMLVGSNRLLCAIFNVLIALVNFFEHLVIKRIQKCN